MSIRVVKVKPRARCQKVVEAADGSLIVHLKAAPDKGKANAELLTLLAEVLQVHPSRIRIKTGHTSRQKLIEIEDNVPSP